jgi:hypothetical protein
MVLEYQCENSGAPKKSAVLAKLRYLKSVVKVQQKSAVLAKLRSKVQCFQTICVGYETGSSLCLVCSLGSSEFTPVL